MVAAGAVAGVLHRADAWTNLFQRQCRSPRCQRCGTTGQRLCLDGVRLVLTLPENYAVSAPADARLVRLATAGAKHGMMQRRCALLSAMLTVALVASPPSALWDAVAQRGDRRVHARTRPVAGFSPARPDWARLILRVKTPALAERTILGEPWPFPLAEARLSTFLAANACDTDWRHSAEQVFPVRPIQTCRRRLNVFNWSMAAAASRFAQLCALFCTAGLPSAASSATLAETQICAGHPH